MRLESRASSKTKTWYKLATWLDHFCHHLFPGKRVQKPWVNQRQTDFYMEIKVNAGKRTSHYQDLLMYTFIMNSSSRKLKMSQVEIKICDRPSCETAASATEGKVRGTTRGSKSSAITISRWVRLKILQQLWKKISIFYRTDPGPIIVLPCHSLCVVLHIPSWCLRKIQSWHI